MRKAIVAGSFYPADKEELEEGIKKLFAGSLASGMPSLKEKKKKKIHGVIAPHAGYAYSGQCATWAYKEIAESEKPDTFIILGTNHTGYVESGFAISTQDFETPLGIVKNDKKFSGLLLETKERGFSIGETQGDKMAHQQEHSIEVQLPFLQFIFKQVKIVPIICQLRSYESYKGFAKLISEVAKKLKRKICIVASSDFTHFGFSYGFVPFSTNIKENLYSLDKGAIDLIIKLKTREFLAYSSKTTICGAGAIALAIECCKSLGSKKVELLKYYTSNDVSGDYGSAVGYSSIVFE